MQLRTECWLTLSYIWLHFRVLVWFLNNLMLVQVGGLRVLMWKCRLVFHFCISFIIIEKHYFAILNNVRHLSLSTHVVHMLDKDISGIRLLKRLLNTKVVFLSLAMDNPASIYLYFGYWVKTKTLTLNLVSHHYKY